MKKLGAFTGLVAAVLLSASAHAESPPAQITILSGPQGGGWYAMAGGLAQFFNNHGVRSTAEVGAGVSNVVLVSNNQAEIGFSMSVVPPAAEAGAPPFDREIDNVYGLFAMGENKVQLLVREDSGVETVSDLAGRRFGSQPVGAVTAESLRLVLEAYGLSEDDVEITRGSQAFGASETQDRRIVGYTATAVPPTPSFMEVTETTDARFLPISDEAFAFLQAANPGFSRSEIPAGTYRGQDEPVPTAATALIIIASDAMTEDEAYWITKTLAENIDEVRALHSQLSNLTLEGMSDVSGIQLHPGAERYYREAGLL